MTRICYSSQFVPGEWIAAHGLMPVRLQPGSGKGVAFQGAGAGVCPFMHALVSDICSDSKCGGLVLTTTCDQMRRAAEVIESESRVPVFLMNVPSTWKSRSASDLYIAELKRLGRFMVGLGGKKPTNKVLADVMVRYERLRKRATLDVDRSMTKGVRLALIGGPVLENDRVLLNMLRKVGGRIVLDGTDTGERTMPAQFDSHHMRVNPLEELANAYFRHIPDVFRRPNEALYDWLKKGITSRSVDGIVLLRYVWCDKWHAEVERLRECFGIPLLDIDLDGADPVGRNATRIQAFIEALK